MFKITFSYNVRRIILLYGTYLCIFFLFHIKGSCVARLFRHRSVSAALRYGLDSEMSSVRADRIIVYRDNPHGI